MEYKVSVLSSCFLPIPSMDYGQKDRVHISAIPGLLGGLWGHLTMGLLQKSPPLLCAGTVRTCPVALQTFSTLEFH